MMPYQQVLILNVGIAGAHDMMGSDLLPIFLSCTQGPVEVIGSRDGLRRL